MNIITLSLYFSYNQFWVYDQTVQLPGCAWTKEHSRQGFAKRESTVCFNTLLEFGDAEVTVAFGPYKPKRDYERVIYVPFLCSSGKVLIEGPEEWDSNRIIDLPRGDYRLTSAQLVSGEEEQIIDLFFELLPTPLEQSAILMADAQLCPSYPLLETAKIAGE